MREGVTIAELSRAYRRGMPAHEIGRRVGCSRSTVIYRLRAAGVPIRDRGGANHGDPEVRRLARLMREQGHGWTEITERLGISHQLAHYHARDVEPGQR